MKTIVRVMTVVALSLALCGSAERAVAQDIFLPSNDAGEDSSSQESPDQEGSPMFPNVQPSQQQAPVQTSDEVAAKPKQQPESDVFVPSEVAPRMTQSPAPDTVREDGVATLADIALKAGMTPEEFNRNRIEYAKEAADNPEMQINDPYVQAQLLADSELYEQALGKRIASSCNRSGFTVSIVSETFMLSKKARENLNKKGVQAVGAMMDDMCSDSRLREKLNANLFMIQIENQPGMKQATLTNDDGIFTITADFSLDNPMASGPMSEAIADRLDVVAENRKNAIAARR